MPPARARLDLAAAYAARGEAAGAVRVRAAVEREKPERLSMDEWLDGAMTWYQCRRPQRASQWARRGAAKQPRNLAAQAVLARCLLAAGQPEAALQSLSDPLLSSSSTG